jgi:hypothetical protein
MASILFPLRWFTIGQGGVGHKPVGRIEDVNGESFRSGFDLRRRRLAPDGLAIAGAMLTRAVSVAVAAREAFRIDARKPTGQFCVSLVPSARW